jgi:hypothetical protein
MSRAGIADWSRRDIVRVENDPADALASCFAASGQAHAKFYLAATVTNL